MTTVAQLRNDLTDEIFKALGLSDSGWVRKLFGPLFWPPTERFSKLAAAFDHQVAREGLQAAIRGLLPRFVSDVKAQGVETIPSEGPVLIASNHPGTYDGLVIAASLPRDDLKIVVGNIPFVRGLKETGRHIIFTAVDAHVRMTVVRDIIRQLKEGGSLLIFPSGKVDPDPAVLPGAHDALTTWSRSLEIILRKVPQTRVVTTIVSGVLSPSAFKNPITRLRKGRRERQLLAEFNQIIQQLLFSRNFSLHPRVTFDQPVTPAELAAVEGPRGMLRALTQRAQRLLSEHAAQPA